jgi:hypothetical protein
MADNVVKFSNAVSTGLSSYLSKKYTFDNVTFSAISTIIALVVTYLMVDAVGMLKELYSTGFEVNKTHISLGILIVSLIIFTYMMKDTIKTSTLSGHVWSTNSPNT